MKRISTVARQPKVLARAVPGIAAHALLAAGAALALLVSLALRALV